MTLVLKVYFVITAIRIVLHINNYLSWLLSTARMSCWPLTTNMLLDITADIFKDIIFFISSCRWAVILLRVETYSATFLLHRFLDKLKSHSCEWNFGLSAENMLNDFAARCTMEDHFFSYFLLPFLSNQPQCYRNSHIQRHSAKYEQNWANLRDWKPMTTWGLHLSTSGFRTPLKLLP